MKKIYLLTIAFAFLAFNLSAQVNFITGGNMEDADAWQVVDLAAGNGHTETFNFTDDGPTGGDGGCLSMSGLGGWSNAAVCQKISIKKGIEYQISMTIKTTVASEFWFEVVVLDSIPTVDADFTGNPIRMALNSWDCADVTTVDGNFGDFNCDAKTTFDDVIFIEGEGDTSVVLAIKTGANSEYNMLIDEVQVMGPEENSTIKSEQLASLEVFPTTVDNELNISLATKIQNIQVVNVLGQQVYSAENIGLNHVTIDFSAPEAGIYYVVVTDINGNVGSVKTIKY